MPRRATDLKDPKSFDHVGRDMGNDELRIGRVLADLADRDERIVAASADLTWATKMGPFFERHPERFFNFGISERNMLSASAGLATIGLIPYVSTFASFAGLLGYEAIRTDMAYPDLPIRVLGTHAGISLGFFGTSHHATEDLAALRAIANLTILSPADGAGSEALIRATVDEPGPIYFRLGRGREGAIYDEAPANYFPGAPHEVRAGTDLGIIATGVMVSAAAEAADALAEAGISAGVLDVHTIKPFPAAEVADWAGHCRAVLSVEEHNVEGGLGTIVRDALADGGVSVPVYKHGIDDEYGIIGPPTHLYRYYGLEGSGVTRVARRLLDALDDGSITGFPVRRLWGSDDRRAVLDRYMVNPPAAVEG